MDYLKFLGVSILCLIFWFFSKHSGVFDIATIVMLFMFVKFSAPARYTVGIGIWLVLVYFLGMLTARVIADRVHAPDFADFRIVADLWTFLIFWVLNPFCYFGGVLIVKIWTRLRASKR